MMVEQQPPATIEHAFGVLKRIVRRLPTTRVPLADALGLTLAENVITDIDSPPFDKAMMDGFAVQAASCRGRGTRWRIAGELGAGQVWPNPVQSDEAVRINTGAPMPPGTDAVLIIEHVQISSDNSSITCSDILEQGAHLAPRGIDSRIADVVLEAGVRMGPGQIAAAASAGAAEIMVYRRPRMAILVTGDELVPVNEKPRDGQIRNSNGPCIEALARQAGCEVLNLGTVTDDREHLMKRVRAGLEADVLCITGGMSMGQHDYVPDVLREAGVEIELQKISIKPGKPTAIGLGPKGQLIFGLAGNPVSCFVCFFIFVRAALAGMQGRSVQLPLSYQAVLDSPLRPAGSRAEFIPVRIAATATGERHALLTRYQGSGDIFGLSRANGLLMREANAPATNPGASVPIIPIDEWTRQE